MMSNTPIVDPVFLQIPKNKLNNLIIWRVENMQLTLVPKEQHGQFYKGDVYLVYSSTLNEQHIHLWIGLESSRDEQGVGAFKMIELDDYLSGSLIQHRECQHYESERFLSYFKSKGALSYLNGGVASGFNHVEKKSNTYYYQLKGKRNVRLIELSTIDWSQMNRSDSFLIDLNRVIFVWNGRFANKQERIQAAKIANIMRDDRGSSNIVIVEDGEEKELGKDELKLFESKLPLKDKSTKLKANESTVEDLKFEREFASQLKLYKCSDSVDDDGTLKIKIIEQKNGPLYRDDLNSEDVFIIDNGKAGIWVWIGKKSSKKERQEAIRNALGYLQAKGYDDKTQNSIKVTRVIEGGESVEFKALFNKWIDLNEQKGLGKTYNVNTTAKVSQIKFDASYLHSNHQIASDSQMVDDGKGIKQIWYVENFDIHLLPESKYGQFNSGDCYIVKYTYSVNNKENYILYYWIGKKSTKDEQGTVALKTIELDKELSGKAIQIRLTECKETRHFMSLFNGRIVIFQGGKASGFKNDSDVKNTDDLGSNLMLQIRSFGLDNTKAIQVDFSAHSLNSNDVFIIINSNETYVWYGKGSTGDERETAKQICKMFKKEPEMIFETQEKDHFWNLLGGKFVYSNEKVLQSSYQSLKTRLFEISNASGKINVQEIYQFTQSDLNPTEVMLLDAWNTLFIWIGRQSNKQEIEESERIAFEYLRTDPSQRPTDIPIVRINQGLEPANFTGFFGTWDSHYFDSIVDYKTYKEDIHSKNKPENIHEIIKEKPKISLNGIKASDLPKYSYDELKKQADELPQGVNPELRELYLTEDDFNIVFKMSFKEFSEKPLWRQKELKRAVRLF